MYAYCGNNPVMNYDPSGKFAITLTTIVLLGIASLITVAAAYEVGVLLQEPVQAAIDALESARLDREAVFHNAGQQVLGGACLPNQRSNTDSKAKDRTIAGTTPKDKKDQGKTYYHVTTSQNAASIMISGVMTGSPWEGGYVYAWENKPNKYAIENSGAHFGTMISFKTNAAFTRDNGIEDPAVGIYGPVVSSSPGPIAVWDVQIVG